MFLSRRIEILLIGSDVMSYTPSSSYPNLVRMSDPLVIRLTNLSMMIGNTNLYAKIKKGYYFNGFQIYVSGSGTAIYEQSMSNSKTTMPNGDKVNVAGVSDAQIINAAKAWLDEVETQIAESTNDNSIQSAIDNLRWQMHYDISKTAATIPESITVDKTAFTISDFYTGLSTDVQGVRDRIAPASKTVYESISDVAQRLKADNDTYTISKALRESGQSSVSKSIYDQTTLIDTEFTSVESTLGSSSDSTSASLFGAINVANAQIGTDAGETVIQKLDAIDTDTSGLSQSITAVSNKIGTNQDSDSGTLWYDVLHRAGTRSMPSGAQYQSDSPLGQIKTNNDSMYTALLGANGALQQAVGYDYVTDNSGGAFVVGSGGTPVATTKYYVRTENSRFGLVYNISGGVSANFAAVKSQPALNQNPW